MILAPDINIQTYLLTYLLTCLPHAGDSDVVFGRLPVSATMFVIIATLRETVAAIVVNLLE